MLYLASIEPTRKGGEEYMWMKHINLTVMVG